MLTAQQIQVPQGTMESWQEIVDILAELAHIPAALIMRLRGEEIEVLLASHSDGNPYHPGDREQCWGSGLYCETVLKKRQQLLVPDALADEQWSNNPDVKHQMIAYLGLPILLPNAEPFGTLCVLDRKPNSYGSLVERVMTKFKGIVESHIELLCMTQQLGDENARLSDYLDELQALRGFVPICAGCKAIRDQDGAWHPVEHYLVNNPRASFSHSLCPDCLKKHYPQIDQDPADQ